MASLLAADSPNTFVVAVTIATSGTDSTVAHLQGNRLVAIETDAAIDGTTITWKAGTQSTSLLALNKSLSDGEDSAVTTGVAASKFISVDPSDFAGCVYLQAIASSQTGATVIRLVCQNL
jgi:hypothetical protein